jgi:hypothetical protein
LQLGVIAAAGAEISVGPAVIENIFALAVGFQIAGHAAEERTGRVIEEKMLREPAGLFRGGPALFQRR